MVEVGKQTLLFVVADFRVQLRDRGPGKPGERVGEEAKEHPRPTQRVGDLLPGRGASLDGGRGPIEQQQELPDAPLGGDPLNHLHAGQCPRVEHVAHCTLVVIEGLKHPEPVEDAQPALQHLTVAYAVDSVGDLSQRESGRRVGPAARVDDRPSQVDERKVLDHCADVAGEGGRKRADHVGR